MSESQNPHAVMRKCDRMQQLGANGDDYYVA